MSIEQEPFSGLNSLETLDLRGNNFTALPRNFAGGLKALTDFRLFTYADGACATCASKEKEGGIVLTEIEDNALAGLQSLTDLDLSGQMLGEGGVGDGVFSKCHRMKRVSLANSGVRILTADMFAGMYVRARDGGGGWEGAGARRGGGGGQRCSNPRRRS